MFQRGDALFHFKQSTGVGGIGGVV